MCVYIDMCVYIYTHIYTHGENYKTNVFPQYLIYTLL